MSTRRVVMLIADIGGYTDYMQFHRSFLGHAEAATKRMLDKVVKAARGFDLIEIEGDAAFLSRDVEGLDGPATLNAVTSSAVTLHAAFHAERRLIELNMCPCGSCKKTSDLTLKFVAHVGEVATQTIQRRKNLVGLDVIHLHRMLKNPVEVPEYLLVSEELFRDGGTESSGLAMHEIDLDLEGIGRVHVALRGHRRHRRSRSRAFLAAAHRRDVRHGRPRRPVRRQRDPPTRTRLSGLSPDRPAPTRAGVASGRGRATRRLPRATRPGGRRPAGRRR